MNNLITKPVETIKEVMEEKKISTQELEKIVTAEVEITEEVATMLQEVLKVDRTFWLNLQKQYNEEINGG